MTYDQFKFCCLVFCKYFEGNTYGPIVNSVPFKNWSYGEHKIEVANSCFLYGYCFSTIDPEEHVIFFLDDTFLTFNIGNDYEYPKFETIKEFLKHFEIVLVDIV